MASGKGLAEDYHSVAFGIMDGVITVLGVIVGLGSLGTRLPVIIGVIVAGLADSFANAAGTHVSEEMEGSSRLHVFKSTGLIFASTFLVTIILLVPVLLFEIAFAVPVCVFIGVALMGSLGFVVSRTAGGHGSMRMAAEYVLIGLVVALISYYLGTFATQFGASFQ